MTHEAMLMRQVSHSFYRSVAARRRTKRQKADVRFIPEVQAIGISGRRRWKMTPEREKLHKDLEQANREFEMVNMDYVEAERSLARIASLWGEKKRAKDAAFKALHSAVTLQDGKQP